MFFKENIDWAQTFSPGPSQTGGGSHLKICQKLFFKFWGFFGQKVKRRDFLGHQHFAFAFRNRWNEPHFHFVEVLQFFPHLVFNTNNFSPFVCAMWPKRCKRAELHFHCCSDVRRSPPSPPRPSRPRQCSQQSWFLLNNHDYDELWENSLSFLQSNFYFFLLELHLQFPVKIITKKCLIGKSK